ncbi:MAG: DUF3179 domain-containing protein [Caldilineae bacterium]|nr:MAG: DUF3179 domain-containing protein [Caldilineae bacterium]
MIGRSILFLLLLAGALTLAACGAAGGGSDTSRSEVPAIATPREYEINFLLSPDSIPPIYDPEFVSADKSPLRDDELVIAITLEGRAKAYPISVLRSREMVNDELAGIPILVTW